MTNVAIPTIQRDLHLSIAGLEWVISSYMGTPEAGPGQVTGPELAGTRS
jgi:hypothetical protein